MQEYGLPQPVFVDDRGGFTVKLYKNPEHDIPILSEYSESLDLIRFCKTPRTRKELSDYLGLNSVTYAIQTRVMPLVEQGVIRMSIPEKPSSSKQMFYSEL